MSYFAATGRVIGWDEDVALTCQCDTREEALAIFVEELWELEWMSCIEPDFPELAEMRELAEANGSGAVINSFFVSETPIKEIA